MKTPLSIRFLVLQANAKSNANRFLCRVFGHKPSREHSFVETTIQVSAFGGMSSCPKKERLIFRYCPRCHKPENVARVKVRAG
jgi:hypothetical protein